jgi:DNA repair exonuclease SbcCD ATPase subunit
MSGERDVSRKRAATGDEAAADVDALYQLSLPEFTAARNALASRLKKSGRSEEADAVKGLQKPPISAWTVNQLFWKHRPAFDKLLDAGQKFRTAQAAQLSGRSTDIRGPLESRREALADLSRLSAQVLRDAGHSPSPDVMRRVTTTLEALATYVGLPDTPRPGRLSDDVDPPGFETLAALVPRVGDGGTTGPSRVLPFQQAPPKKKTRSSKADPKEQEREREAGRKAQLAAAKVAVQQSEQALRGARKQAEQAESQLKKAAARAKESERDLREVEKEKAAIDKRYEKAAADAESARQEARAVAERAEAAAESVEDAERELEKARRELTTLS